MSEIPLPETTLTLIGHKTAEQFLLARAMEHKLPHALLFAGAKGIGKATLAFRLARFLLSGKDVEAGGFFAPDSLSVAADDPTGKRVTALSHSDLMLIRPAYDEKKEEFKDEIQIEAIRKLKDFMALTPAESRWRIAIIDSADQLNIAAANALLKVLEEPPRNTLLMLVSHQPGKLLATIRSRCQRLDFKALSHEESRSILATHAAELGSEESKLLSLLANHSPGLALQLHEAGAVEQFREFLAVLAQLPQLPAATVMGWAESAIGRKGRAEWKSLSAVILASLYLMVCLRSGATEAQEIPQEIRDSLNHAAALKPLDYWLDLWENAGHWLADAERLHLDRKQVLISILHAFDGQVLAA